VAVAAAVLAVTSDAAGRLLFGLLALWLAGVVAADLVLRPRLRADTVELEIRTFAVRRRMPWSAVQRLTVDARSRYGLTSRALEVEAGDTLVLLGRRSLGADPREVAAALADLRAGNAAAE
jgi:hypothetical protein